MDNVLEYVKEKWKLLTAFSKKDELKEQLWEEIVYLYSAQHRHYHNLTHIAYLFDLCDQYLGQVKNPAVVGFAIMYHDVVYDTFRKDNVEQSALFAQNQLRQLNVNSSLLNNVKQFILASKKHQVPPNTFLKEDLELFLDFDMAILAAEPNLYQLYSHKIRQEYAKYTDDIYKQGRKLALESILSSPSIFASTNFKEEMEDKARKNIANEISML
jgi:predicted metal-dependent HD superfamily phosphohydrolase